MAEIMEVFEDIRRKTGDKGFFILIGGALLFGLYHLTKGTQAETASVTVSATYPDVDTNADVVIDTILDAIEYSDGITLEALENQESQIQDMGDSIKAELKENFKATNDYINKGFESQEKLAQTIGNDIQATVTQSAKDIIANNNKNAQTTQNVVKSTAQTTQNVVKSTAKTTQNVVKKAQTTAKKATTTAKKATAKKTTAKKSGTSYYTYKTKKGLNTGTSIVDALKATGVNSSFANRKKIAQANGIKNYTGSASQNISLLNKLKAGKLKKV